MSRETAAFTLYEILYCPNPNDIWASYPSASNGAERRTSMSTSRKERQARVGLWVLAAFGKEQADSLPHRGLRMLEEALELAQAAGTDQDMAHRLVDYVYSRPVGEIGNELGGLSVTMMALANTAGLDLDEQEAKEVRRIFSKPLEYYTRRNAAKNAAGFDGTPKVCISIETKYVMPGWGCCQCNTYNGDNRPVCKNCQHPRCGGAS